MIQLVKGSIFDSKCDLIIIPCNTSGGVTRSVKNDVFAYDLPFYGKKIEFGDVNYIDSLGSFSIASVVGYAASVNIHSNIKIIEKISKNIVNYCLKCNIIKVNVPLLGTGAGGLHFKDSYEIMKNVFEKNNNTLFCIYTYSEDIYNELSSEDNKNTTSYLKHPRVFISYTGFDINNRNWVKEFACKLRKSGIDARLDIFHLSPGQDLPQWMTNEISMADKVLIICDKFYSVKADNRSGGVGWETMIIQGDMLMNANSNKYIIISRDNNIDRSLPVYLKSKYTLNWSDDNQMEKDFENFILYLYGCDIAPPLEDIPDFVKSKLNKT